MRIPGKVGKRRRPLPGNRPPTPRSRPRNYQTTRPGAARRGRWWWLSRRGCARWRRRRKPAWNESWAPVVEGIHNGNFFGTTGEILFHDWKIEGAGAKSVYTANIEYTFPLD